MDEEAASEFLDEALGEQGELAWPGTKRHPLFISLGAFQFTQARFFTSAIFIQKCSSFLFKTYGNRIICTAESRLNGARHDVSALKS